MKEKEFDNFIKIKIDHLNNLTGIEFDEHNVWKKVGTKIPKNGTGGVYFFVTVSILAFLAITYFFIFVPNSSIPDEKEISIPLDKKIELVIDTLASKEIIKKTKRVTSKKNNPHIVEINKELISETNEISDTNVRVNIRMDTFNLKSRDINKVEQPTSVIKRSYPKDVPIISETRAYVHVYRPGKIAGALNMFSFKANGKKIGTIANGEYEIFMVEPGLTEFEIKRKKIVIELEAGTSYYLRTELIFLGKTKFERVTESFAREELGSKK